MDKSLEQSTENSIIKWIDRCSPIDKMAYWKRENKRKARSSKNRKLICGVLPQINERVGNPVVSRCDWFLPLQWRHEPCSPVVTPWNKSLIKFGCSVILQDSHLSAPCHAAWWKPAELQRWSGKRNSLTRCCHLLSQLYGENKYNKRKLNTRCRPWNGVLDEKSVDCQCISPPSLAVEFTE